MKIKHVLMAGAALLISAPLAFAATNADEKEVTRQLNQQQLSSPGSTADASSTSADTSMDTTASSSTASDESMTDDTMTTADAKTADEAPDATPMTNEDRPDANNTDDARHDSGPVGQAVNEMANEIDQAASPDAPLTEDAAKNGIQLSAVETPKDTLANATVETTGGEAVGEVQTVLTGSDGKATAIVVEAGGFLGIDEKPVQISADNFVYIPDRNILVTELDKEGIEKMAAAN